LNNTENIGQEHALALQMTVFPNPASDVVKFRFERAIEKDAVIRLYSGLGQLQDTIQINVADWHSGMYFYGVYLEGRLMKQGQVLVQR
jgi:hypothetical protein